MSYVCSCGLTNCSANKQCPFCSKANPDRLDTKTWLDTVLGSKIDSFGSGRQGYDMANGRNEELHAQFFNHEAKNVADMDYATLSAHLDELELIAFEARARASATSDKMRKMRADMSEADRDKLISRPDFTSSERSKLPTRVMTKADKAIEGMASLGISDEDLAALTANLVRKVKPENGKAAITPKPSIQPTFNKPSIEVAKPALTTQATLLAEVDIANRVKDVSQGNYFNEPKPTELDGIAKAATLAGHIANKLVEHSEPRAFNTMNEPTIPSVTDNQRSDCTCGCSKEKHIPFIGCIAHKCKTFNVA